MKDDRFIKYLEIYYKEHKTINDISRDTIVIFEGTPLKIGEFLASIRKQHKLFSANDSSRGSMSETSIKRYEILDKLEFEWEPLAKKQKELEENDICLIFVEQYYKKYQTLEGIPEKFTLEEKEYSIRNFFTRIRSQHRKYISNENSNGSNSPTSIRRYKVLDSINFDWNPSETKKEQYETDDKYMKYIVNYYKEHQTLENIPKIVIYEGVELNIECFLSDRRKIHKKHHVDREYKMSELEAKRQKQLDDISFDWTPKETKQQELIENDKYIEYLKEHYIEKQTINDIKSNQEVEYKGEILKIGDFISSMRKKYLAYVSKNKTTTGIDTPVALKRYQELQEMGLDWRPSESQVSLAKIARVHGLKRKKLRTYVELFNGDIEKAIKICKSSAKYRKTVRKVQQGISPNLSTIAQEFEVDLETLNSLLNKPQLKANRPNQTLMYDENTNLRQYCIDNGLNYRVIQKAVKLRMKGLCKEDLQSLINRCIVEYKTNGQKQPATWIYSKYGNQVLVSHLLTYLNLDSEAILNDMSENCIDLNEAIENNCFKRASKTKYDYLEFIYKDIIKTYKKAEKQDIKDKELLDEILNLLLTENCKEYKLTEEETNFINSCIEHYISSIEQYKLFDVGFEKNEEKRIEKIIEYNLDEDDIEEAFFMPLKFDQKALIGRNSQLYKRRILLKNIIVSWSYLSEKEQQEKKVKYKLTEEETKYVTKTRKKIDEIKQKVYKK